MAIVVTDQPTPSGNDTAGASTYPTGTAVGWASWTPPKTPGTVLFALVVHSATAANLTTPTVTGNGVTWTLQTTIPYDSIATPTRRASLFRALGVGSSVGGITVDFAGSAQTGCLLSVASGTGLNTSGDTDSAAAMGTANTLAQDTANTTGSVTLASFFTTNNAVLFGVGVSGTATLAADALQTGYTLGTQQGYLTPSVTGGMEWRLNSDTAPQITWVGNNRWGSVGAELIAEPKLGVLINVPPATSATSAFATSGSQVGATYSFNHEIISNANRCLVVTVKLLATGTVSGITFDSVALSHDTGADVANGVFRTETWYLVSPNTGIKTIAVTLSAAVASVSDAGSYYNVDQISPIEARNTATGTGGVSNGTAAVSVTTLGVGSMAVASLVTGVISANTSRSIQNGREQTIVAAVGGADLDDIGAVLTPGTASFSWNFTGTSAPWAASAVSLRSAVAKLFLTLGLGT